MGLFPISCTRRAATGDTRKRIQQMEDSCLQLICGTSCDSVLLMLNDLTRFKKQWNKLVGGKSINTCAQEVSELIYALQSVKVLIKCCYMQHFSFCFSFKNVCSWEGCACLFLCFNTHSVEMNLETGRWAGHTTGQT